MSLFQVIHDQARVLFRLHLQPRLARAADQQSVAQAAILLRQPRWRSEAEVRAEYEAGAMPAEAIEELGAAEPGRVAIDLAIVDARPADATATDSLLAVEGRDGSSLSLARSLGRLPAYVRAMA